VRPPGRNRRRLLAVTLTATAALTADKDDFAGEDDLAVAVDDFAAEARRAPAVEALAQVATDVRSDAAEVYEAFARCVPRS
jgi:hypothetical protein